MKKSKADKKRMLVGGLLVAGGFTLIIGGLLIGDYLLSLPAGVRTAIAGLAVI